MKHNTKDNTPTYLAWFWETKGIFTKLITLVALVSPLLISVFALPKLDDTLGKVVMCLISFWFSCYVIYQPLKTYKRFLEIGWFKRNNYITNKPLK